ncbi:hypothetical protein [Nocardia colli]|uniref:hypothetical protein n=1 Tax=Nocardia colli TaxID=2545717 RepID=UPI0035E20EF7
MKKRSLDSIVKLGVIASILAMASAAIFPSDIADVEVQRPSLVSIVVIGIVTAAFSMVIFAIAPPVLHQPVAIVREEIRAVDNALRATVTAYIAVTIFSDRFFAAGTVTTNSAGTVVTAVRVQLWVNDELQGDSLCEGIVSRHLGDTKQCRTDLFNRNVNRLPSADTMFCIVTYIIEEGGLIEERSVRSESCRF